LLKEVPGRSVLVPLAHHAAQAKHRQRERTLLVLNMYRNVLTRFTTMKVATRKCMVA
jgi:hypothetical protein